MAKKSRAQNTLINSAAGFCERLVVFLLGFVMRSIFIRFLGIEYAGVSSLFTDILSALSLAELGISGAITYALYKPIAEADHEKVAQLMNFYKKAYRVVAAVIFGVGCLLLPFIGFIVKDVPAELEGSLAVIYLLYVINSAVSYLFVYKAALLTANQQNRYVSMVNIIGNLVRIVIEAVVLLALRSVLPPTPRFIAYLIAGIVITRTQNYVVSVVATKKHPELNRYSDAKLPKEERRKLFKDIGAMMIYKVCNSILNSVDSIIVSVMFGTVYVGYMGNYTLITKRISNLVNQFYKSATPSIGNLVATSDREKQYSTFRIVQFLAFWIGTFCSVSFFVLLDPFIHLWLGSTRYMLGMPVAAVVTLNFYIGTISHPLTTFRNSNGLFIQGRYRPIIMTVINISLSVLLAMAFGSGGSDPRGGIFAVKLATIIAQLTTMQWYDPYLIYSRVFKRSVFGYYGCYLCQLAIMVGCCAGTYLLGTCIDSIENISPYVSFAVKCVMCVLIPNAVIVLLYFRRDEFRGLLKIIRGLSSRKKKKTAAWTAS